jgi:GntR family transcriptional regulator, carbon starvation induced regulator
MDEYAEQPSMRLTTAMTSHQHDRVRTLAERALHLIRDDILSGQLTPGRKLKPDDLKREYRIGTSPIREALLRLSAEGLVRLEGQRGFSVPHQSEEELRDIANLRCLLSCHALALAIERGDDMWESAIVAAFHRLEKVATSMKLSPEKHREQWDRCNLEFHAALEAACGSPWLLRLSAVALSQSERYRRNTIEYDKLLPAVQKDHRAIMNAAISRDAKEACALLTRHINEGAERVLRVMRSRQKPQGAQRSVNRLASNSRGLVPKR